MALDTSFDALGLSFGLQSGRAPHFGADGVRVPRGAAGAEITVNLDNLPRLTHYWNIEESMC